MGRRTRECYLCGEKYHYCPTCSQDKGKPTWMIEFHEENCKTVFQICTDFNMKFLTKDEAKESLSKCNLSNKSNFRASVQNTLATIFAEDPKPVVEKNEKEPAPAAPKTVKAPAIKVEKAVKAPVAPKAAKTPVVEKTETIIAPEKAETIHEVVTETEEK